MFENIFEQFHRDGYVLIDNFLSSEETEELKNEINKVIDEMPPQTETAIFSTDDNEALKNQYLLDSADKVSFFYEKGAVGGDGELLVDPHLAFNKIGHTLHRDNQLFRKISFDERVKEVCFQLKMAEPVIVQSMYIFKNPKIGGEVLPHQDASYLYTEPLKTIGFWIALDDATLENGCLWFARGSHKSGVHRRFIRNPDPAADPPLMYTGPSPHYQKSSFTAVPVKKGSCILIHGQVVHSSESNKSDKQRNAYTFHVIEQKNTKYCSKNWCQAKDGVFMNVYRNV
ncbi:hypothetical protein PPYR_10006 [Photinus pyralis]|uniref:Fe2OG dioxygenase domain-containing protein n=1 Tax=Photinus pyralis TaxID=7054 RepID=A0A1Y1KXX9_PHOPY|nr:phytanoyl-CoA dioxygenase domain-containing protein 1 [Photinus pyralis]KAB0795945.1 hypothetical protein PPYR_10006 [Photinus pyralis]